jgi:RimJ/RimL family protein N-acetyltransferase
MAQGGKMADLVFAPVDEAAYQVLASWFEDPELRQRYNRPTQPWLDYVRKQPGVHAWMILEDNQPVGLLQLDIDAANTGYIGYYVKPALRGQGYGRRLLQAFLARPEVQGLHRVIGSVAPDNAASIRCLLSAGFVPMGDLPDDEGQLGFVFNPGPAVA